MVNFGIDFAGGVSIEARINQKPNLASMREVLSKLDVGEVMLQNFGSEKDISIRIGNLAKEEDLTQKVEKIKSV